MEQHTTYSRVERNKQRKKQKKRNNKTWLIVGIVFIAIVAIGVAAWPYNGVEQTDGSAGAEQPVNGKNDLIDKGQQVDGDEVTGSDPDSNAERGTDGGVERPDGVDDRDDRDERLDEDELDETEDGLAEAETETEAADEDGNSDPAMTDQQKQHVKLSFVGDVLLGSTVENLLESHGYDYPYTNITELFSDSDIVAANLETPITERGEPEDKQYAYRSKPAVLPAFKEAGFDLVTLANNHILDYWHVGLLDTLEHLDAHGISRVGAGVDEEEAFAPVIKEVGGVKVAYVGLSRVLPKNEWKATIYQPGVAESYSPERSVAAIEQAKEEADLVIVLAHWGTEREREPNEHQITNAHAYIDAGADLVVGSHPHVLQSFEQYNGKWIAYSLGNFIFTTNAEHRETWEGGVLHATCSVSGDCELELIPVWNQWAKPTPMDAEEAAVVFDRLENENVQIDEQGKINARTNEE